MSRLSEDTGDYRKGRTLGMIILGIDYGEVRTGVAVCDRLELLASPVEVISQRNQEKLLQRIVSIAREQQAEKIVVGHPLNMDASAGEKAQVCAAFAQTLAELSGIPTTLWDERLTTVSAHQALNDTNKRGKKRKAVIDAVAAVILLQSYLDWRRLHEGG